MRIVAPLVFLFSINNAFAQAPAGESRQCAALADAEHAVFDTEVAIGQAKAMVWGERYQQRIATAEADERDGLVADRDQARQELPELRRDLKGKRGELREVRKGIRTSELACEDSTEASDVT